MRVSRLALWIFLATWMAGMAVAQDTASPPPPSPPDRVAQYQAQMAATVPTEDELSGLDAAGKQALQESLTAYYRYRESGYQHRRAVFDWQLLSSRIIFAVVILLVSVGVFFSWLQFRADTRAASRRPRGPLPGAAPGAAAEAKPVTSIGLTKEGIQVSSPVLGVIILMISLAFFYLYLVYVYPVTELF
jgi:hypothetical protein